MKTLIVMINASNAILIIIVRKILMENRMDSVFVSMVIMMIIKIHYVNSALNFGIFYFKN